MFQEYFENIQRDYLSDSDSSEHSYRTYLQNLLNRFVLEKTNRELIIKHEPTAHSTKSRPDFKVTTSFQLTIGLIETKKIGTELSKLLSSEQLERYNNLSENIILTDYLSFYLLKNGEIVFDSWVCREYQLEKKRFKLEKTRIEEMSKLFQQFFESEPAPIFTTNDLAVKLSRKARFLNEFAFQELENTDDEMNLLYSIYGAFKESLLPLMDKKYFADIYAQTIAYGLFLAALNTNAPRTELNKVTSYSLIPSNFPLIKDLFHRLDDFPADVVWAVDEVISVLKAVDFVSIKQEFAKYRSAENGFNDPFVYFYEDFLKEYDKTQREIRGVYYTPEPVVSFIVRSVEEILKEKFLLHDGFLDKRVTVLDFACGTGTFLLHVFKLALESCSKYGDKVLANRLLNESMLNNFYGFELLVAPYIVANLKISEYLKEHGYSIDKDKRINILLTNTLTHQEAQTIPGMPILSKEGREANRIKDKDILVIIGNPPYSGHSANKGDWISKELSEYYKVDGVALDEKNPKWLQDDYVKFIRFAQWKMDKVERGVVGIISNHSFLDNPTFRGMRQSLMNSFDEIYILDLHGNVKKKETSPDGSKDENVFDIQQGTTISIFLKKNRESKDCKVFHIDSFGKRQQKYQELNDSVLSKAKWDAIKPISPFYLFKPRSEKLLNKYNEGISLNEIFKQYSVGIVTSRDEFVIDTNLDRLKKRINEFRDLKISNEDITNKYNLKNNSKFDLTNSRRQVSSYSKQELESKFIKIAYRPFDYRYIFYDDKLIERMRKAVMLNMQEENIGLISVRQVAETSFNHIFISKFLIESRMTLSNKGIAYFYPLYLLANGAEQIFFQANEQEIAYYSKEENGKLFDYKLNKTPNLKESFLEYFSKKYQSTYSPEQILGYIYAILHSPTFRTKYIDFLRIDFPRIQFIDNEQMFANLSKIGTELIQHHLLQIENKASISSFSGDGNNFKVEKVDYSKEKLWINKQRYFDNVPESIWNFQIGGYKVLDKWLKERKKIGFPLESTDIIHLLNVIDIIGNTLGIMEKIDKFTFDWI